MKKIYSFLLVMLAGVCSFVASASHQITINVDDVDRVEVKIYNQESYEYDAQTLQNGDNQFTINDYQYVYVMAKEGNALLSVTRKKSADAEEIPFSIRYSSGSGAGAGWQAYFYAQAYDSYDGNIITVKSAPLSEARSAHCTVKVDDASKVRLQNKATYEEVKLENGENSIAFIPDVENGFYLSYTGALYKVTLNDEELTNYQSLTVKDGDVIDIQANFPDVECKVDFDYADAEAAQGFVTSVLVDGTEVTDFSNGFTVKMGQTVTIYADVTGYKVDEFSINGEIISIYAYQGWSTSFTVKQETNTIRIAAHKYGTIPFTLILNDIDHVKVYNGYRYEDNLLKSLVVGENKLEVSENNASLCVVMENPDYMVSISDGMNTYDSGNQFTVTKDMVVTVTTTLIERNNSFVLYIDNRELADYSFAVDRNSDPERGWRTSETLSDFATGYNVVNFMDAEVYFTLSYYSSYSDLARKLYINDKETEMTRDNGSGATWEFTAANGDVVKLYLAAEPQVYNVSFDIASGCSVSDVKSDRVVERTTTAFDVLTGTEVTFTASAGATVSVGEETIVAGEDGAYTVIVSDDTTIKVSPSISSAMENVLAEQDNNVYTLQGVLLLQNATQEQINNLPQGMYIINGKTRCLWQK